MSTEHVTQDDLSELDQQPPVVPISERKRKTRRDARDPAVASGDAPADVAGPPSDWQQPATTPAPAGGYASAPLKGLRNAEDQTIRQMVEAFGPGGSFQIVVKRMDPEEARDPVSGRMVKCGGHVGTVDDKVIDEEWVAKKYGGGKYSLVIRRKNEKGSYVYATTKTLVIAGEPNLTDLPGFQVTTSAAVAPAGVVGEAPSVVTKVLEMAAAQVADANSRADRREEPRIVANPAMDAMLGMMKDQLAQAHVQMEAMRREVAEVRNVPPPPVDTYKEKMLDRMLADDSSRLQAVRFQFESELRAAKENAIAEERRIRDSFERDKLYAQQQHEREITLLRVSHESQMTALRSSHEVQLSSARLGHDAQAKLSDSEIRRLERDNSELRVEVKELRAKKEKGILEQLKEVETIKEALGGDGDDRSTGDKLLEAVTNPEAWAAAASIFKRPAAVAPAPAPAPQLPTGPRVMVGPNGQRFVMGPDGQYIPAKRRKRTVAAAAAAAPAAAPGTPEADAEAVAEAAEAEVEEAPLPVIDQTDLDQLVGFFENAFAAGTDPDVVAQGVRGRIPGEVLTYLRDRVTEFGLAKGVDTFLVKVAHLPGTSPLVAQAGRNWIRKVGGALVGE